MRQNYTIFIKDKPLHIVHEAARDAIQIALPKADSSKFLMKIIAEMQSLDTFNEVFLIHEAPEQVMALLQENMTLVLAAGGLVKNSRDELLMIFRRHKWDLPKGKVESGENIKTAAVREVEEECGIKGMKVRSHIADSYHIYYENERPILKQTVWYHISTAYEGITKPQIEEGIDKVEWVKTDGIENRLQNSYASIRWILEQGGVFKSGNS